MKPVEIEPELQLAQRLRDKFTFAKPCIVHDAPDAQTVWIKVGDQSFQIDGYQETKADADWMRLMIGKALLSLLLDTEALSVQQQIGSNTN